ncbi:unnamed protein product [Thelazia callipaeda]|uniref:Ovule protein n=1 Tax=Thelazia callipaeda TaxID=103827 RepID=A0A0N5DCI1_THECL|nr:unnamed protein product [Thelazia callipaeda]
MGGLNHSPRLKSRTENRTTQPINKAELETTMPFVQSKRLTRKDLGVSPEMLKLFGLKPKTDENTCLQHVKKPSAQQKTP